MKKNYFKGFALLLLSLSSIVFAQTAGTLTFTFTTPKHTTGNYVSDGRFVLAAWVETSAGTFVKTKMRYVGGNTDDHLSVWGTAAGCADPTAVLGTSGCNTTDATTGATLTSFLSKNFTWDGKNVSGTSNGTLVADGTYRVAVQETWGHSSNTATRYFTFTKGPSQDLQTPAADANFTGITLKWTPNTLATVDVNSAKSTNQIYPNPANNNFSIANNELVYEVVLYDASGRFIKSLGKADQYNVSDLKNGVYYVELKSEKTKLPIQKLIKN